MNNKEQAVRRDINFTIGQIRTDLKYALMSERDTTITLTHVCRLQQKLIEALIERAFAPVPKIIEPYWNLRALRKAYNIDQKTLAKELNVTRTTISRWENGHHNISNEYKDQLTIYFQKLQRRIEK